MAARLECSAAGK